MTPDRLTLAKEISVTREVDLFTAGTLNAFEPTDNQIALKLLLQERVNPKILVKLTRNQFEEIEPFIAPFKPEEVSKWFKVPGFWEWLLMPDSFKVTLEKAKEDAANAVVDLLRLDMCSEEVNPKIAMIKLKAAELLLKTDFTPKQRINQTIKFNNAIIPKHLANKSLEALESEFKQLQEQNV